MRVLIEGRPASGKTTAADRLSRLLLAQGIDVRGFVTHEIRQGRTRVGFTVRSFDGDEATLAHVDLPGPPHVGKYGVDLTAFERIALPALDAPPASGIVVIDELGKMELASKRFREAVLDLLEARVAVVATIHAFRDPFTDAIKRRGGIESIKLTRSNRDELPASLAARVSRALAERQAGEWS